MQESAPQRPSPSHRSSHRRSAPSGWGWRLLLLTALVILDIPARARGEHVGGLDFGASHCPCLGRLPDRIPDIDCAASFAFHGQCIRVDDGFLPATPLYPGDYGESCKKHQEPASSSCYDVASGAELPASERASWCDSPWCYVDPANCRASDTAESGYFSSSGTVGALVYSYATCGSTDTYMPVSSYISRSLDAMLIQAEIAFPRCQLSVSCRIPLPDPLWQVPGTQVLR